MAGHDIPADPAKALEYKDSGNKCFQTGDYASAEALYSKASVSLTFRFSLTDKYLHYRIMYDPTNATLYTNRSLTLLKLSKFPSVIEDSLHAIALSPPPTINMKAHFQLAQAQIALHHAESALDNAKIAHKLCVDEVVSGGKGGSSIGPITELVLRCKKERWEEHEDERLRAIPGLLSDVIRSLERNRDEDVAALNLDKEHDKVKDIEAKLQEKIKEVRKMFELAGATDKEAKRRKVPDWCLDDITFSVMLDPVVVCPPLFQDIRNANFREDQDGTIL